MEVKDAEGTDFLCPYCAEVLKEILRKNVKVGRITARPIYACPHCKKVLPAPNSM